MQSPRADRTYREVQQRTTPSSDGTLSTCNVTIDTGVNSHLMAKVSDMRAASQKVWTFTFNGSGLATTYEEGPAVGTALLHKDYTRSAGAAGNVYVGAVVTTQNPGRARCSPRARRRWTCTGTSRSRRYLRTAT